MKVSRHAWLLTALAAAAPSCGWAQADCSQYLTSTSPTGMEALTLRYTPDVAAGVLRGQVVYEGRGWVGFAVSENGRMIGSHAVIGLPDETTALKYALGGLSAALIAEASSQEGLTASIVQNDTHSVLEFEWAFEDPIDSTFDIDPNGVNNFLVAAGSGNELAYHALRSPLVEQLVGCETVAVLDEAVVSPMMEDDEEEDPMMEDEEEEEEEETPMAQDEAEDEETPMMEGGEEEEDTGGNIMENTAESSNANIMVGDTITHEGYVLDRFCIEQGVFLDQPEVASLANPDLHTVHCLIDAPPCIGSEFELLDEGEKIGDYVRAFTLDEASKELVVALAKEIGGPSCTECDGTGSLLKGFRVRVTATVTALGDPMIGNGPVISVTEATAVFPFVGQAIEHEGYVLDRFCIDQGVFLDQPEVASLMNPDLHTVHCLIDAPPCIASVFEVLGPPAMTGEDYTRAYVLDEASKAQVVSVAKDLGGPSCTECNGVGHLSKGLRVAIEATITALGGQEEEAPDAGPVLSVTKCDGVFPFAGQEIELEGVFISDQFCLERGTFLDNDLPSLEQPEKHTIHCLIDPPPCISSPFEVLLDPLEGETMHQRGYTLDQESKDFFVDIIKTVGVCDECTGEGTLVEGFRAALVATIGDASRNETSGSGPLISVSTGEAVLPEIMAPVYEVGQQITVEGYVTDQFCIQRGSFLDTGLPTLENVDRHTLHCLLDPPPCLESPFEILMDPDFSAGDTMWSRGFTLDEDAKQQVIELGRSIGNCDTCSGGETGQLAGLRVLLEATILDNLFNTTSGAGPLISVQSVESVGQYSIGQEIVVEGYIIDQFCIERGTFLDTGLPTLENANQHTVHCLIDPPPCSSALYEVLLDPVGESTTWSRGFTLDEASKAELVALAMEVGDCDLCTGEGTLKAGFRAKLTATVVDNMRNLTSGAGPVISVSSAEHVLPEIPDISLPVGECDAATGPTTIALENTPITVTYELGADDAGMATFSATVVYEGQGWVGFAISEAGKMQGSLAVIGLPDEDVGPSNPGKYDLEALSVAGVVLTEQQTLMDGNIEQNETHTVLSFTKLVEEEGELSINPTGNNFFLVAAGSGNELAYHAVRMPFEIALGCAVVKPELAMPNLSVGDIVTVEGFVMDNFCIERGTLLDEPQIVTLEEPNLHTLHCLIDVPQCAASNYEILMDPLPGETLYRRALTLDDASKEQVRMMAQAIGRCDTCGGGRRLQDSGRVERGFRANVTAEVTALADASTGAPPMVVLSDVQPVLFITDASSMVTLEVGDLVTVEGFIMDNFCIERGE